jgi:hypothetical protein
VAYELCEVLNATNCDEANVTVVVSASTLVGNTDTNNSVNGLVGGSVIPDVSINDTLNGSTTTVLGTDVNITNVTNTTPYLDINKTTGEATVSENTPEGNYTETYTICENLNPTNCTDVNVTVEVVPAVIDAVDDDFTGTSVNGIDGGVAGDVTDNDTLNAIAVVDADMNISVVNDADTNLTGVSIDGTGSLNVPIGTIAGTYNVKYSICENLNPSNCDEANVTVSVVPAPILGTNDSNNSVNGSNGGVAISNVASNDTLNGSSVTLNTDVNITAVTTDGTLTINPSTGAVSVPVGTQAGDYSATYTICEILNPSNCVTNEINVTVNPAAIVAIDDNFSTNPINGLTGGVVGDVTTTGDDSLNAVDVVDSLITLEIVTADTNLSGVSVDNNGSLNVPAGTMAGTYNVAYELCEVLNATNCDEANVTVKVDPAVIRAVDDSNGSINGVDGGVVITNLTSNDTLNGNLVILGTDVNITAVTNNTPLIVNLATGEVSVPVNTPSGVYVETYTICEKLNPSNCTEGNVSIGVDASLVSAVNDTLTVNGLIGGALNIKENDRLDGNSFSLGR